MYFRAMNFLKGAAPLLPAFFCFGGLLSTRGGRGALPRAFTGASYTRLSARLTIVVLSGRVFGNG